MFFQVSLTEGGWVGVYEGDKAYVSWWRRRERLVHAALDGQFDVVSVHGGLLGMCGVNLGVLDDGRHISCERKLSDLMLTMFKLHKQQKQTSDSLQQ